MNQQRRTRLPAAERRETILRAATEVFALAGYRAAKVSDVADRIGVTEPVIFQNFGSKAALFAAVLERAAAEIGASLDHMTDGLRRGVRAAGSHTQSARAGTANPGDAGPAPVTHGGCLRRAVRRRSRAGHGADLAGPARNAIRAVAAHLTDLIQRAQDAGDVSPDADPRAAAWLLLSVLSGPSAPRSRHASQP